MTTLRMSRSVFSCSCLIAALALLSVEARAQERPSGGRGLYGDWLVKMDFGGRQMESIISFSRDAEGNRKGEWISFMGVSELQDLKFEEGKISFTQVRQNREGQTMTSKFTGTMADGKLSGTLSSDRGEVKVEGTPLPRMPRAAGTWAVKFKMGEREITTNFVIKAGEGRALAIDWPSERVKHSVSDVSYERGKLTFKTKSKMEEREWESTFEGTIEGDKLSGTLKSERGESAVEGTRVGAPLIGTWNLDLASDRGTRKQRLRVNPDLSGWFGSIPVKSIELQDGKVTFKVSVEFGDQKFETSFAGSVKEAALSGELTSARGTQKVTGTKVVRRGRQAQGTRL
jgi:hypothetical protein